MLPTPNVHVEALLPYTAGSLMSRVREYGKVINVEYRDDGMMLEAEVDDQLARAGSWSRPSTELPRKPFPMTFTGAAVQTLQRIATAAFQRAQCM